MSEPLAVREAPGIYRVESVGRASARQVGLKPDLPMCPPGYKQTEVGVIPDDWDCLSIGNFTDLLTGFPFPSSGYSKSGVRLLRGFNVKRGATDWSEDGTEYWPAITSQIRKYVLKAGDIVIAMDGSLVGRSFAMLSKSDVPAVLLQRVARVRTESIEQKYLKAWICSQRFSEHCDAVKTVTAIPHISPADIRSFKVALPPTKAEQEAIAEALSDADALIESLEQLIAKKRHLKQGAMQELLTGKKRLPGFSGEWEVKRLSALANIQRGASPRPIDSPIWFDENSSVGWVRISDVTKSGMYLRETTQRLSPLGVEHSRPVSCGSLIMSICATVGRPVITEIDTCIHDGFVVFDNLRADKHLLYYILKSIEQDWSKHGQTGSQMNLNTGLINQTEVSISPDAKEQTAIATILSDMDADIAALEQQLAKARGIKQGMMQELLTGRVRLV